MKEFYNSKINDCCVINQRTHMKKLERRGISRKSQKFWPESLAPLMLLAENFNASQV